VSLKFFSYDCIVLYISSAFDITLFVFVLDSLLSLLSITIGFWRFFNLRIKIKHKNKNVKIPIPNAMYHIM
jgi:hypothetical protein